MEAATLAPSPESPAAPPPAPLGASADSARASVACSHLASGYFGKRVLEDISFSIKDPGIYVVLGRNGAGKTTLFRTLAGVLAPLSGSVAIAGAPGGSRGASERLHYLSHFDGIPDGLRVEEALAFWARVQGVGRERVEAVMERFELSQLRGKFFSGLSQGQKKRVSVARVFLQERAIYLLDEPTANLDPKVATAIRDLILKLAQSRVVLYSSHNLFEAREIGRHVLALSAGKLAFFGRISELRPSRYVIGVRVAGPAGPLAGTPREGDYYLHELAGPEEVPRFVRELIGGGVEIVEVKEMRNPLEDLFE